LEAANSDVQAKRVLKEVNANPGEQGYTHMVKKPGQLSDDATQLPTELPGFSKLDVYGHQLINSELSYTEYNQH
jgi:hypothetical protein